MQQVGQINASPRVPMPELREAGLTRLEMMSAKVKGAMQDDAKRLDLVKFLTAFANAPRGLHDSMKDAGIDVLELICVAHAMIEAAEQFDRRKKRGRQDAEWFQSMAKTYLRHAADRFGILAVQRANLMQAETHREGVMRASGKQETVN